MIDVLRDIRELQKTNKFLLDANVCLFIFGPPDFCYQDSARSSKYINSQKDWWKDNAFVCRPVLSEFVNQCFDYYYRVWRRDESPPKPNGKKDFRKSDYYKNRKIADKIVQYVIEMLNSIECCDSKFDKPKAYGFLKEFIKCKMDFNDIIIEEICKNNSLSLITDDGDFKNCGVEVFTANV